ncbi:MAG TPA: serine/threonine protein kinase, partial [Cyanothece sp. UBA12306]|nr:serine/threonine protein kinase [Cyanothece sp. UBA12306]
PRCRGCGEDLSQTAKEYLFHQYRVIKILGEGGFGRTYLVQDTHLRDQLRVLKKLITPMEGNNLKKVQELFQREAKRLSEFSHAQIPKLHAYFLENDSLYLVQEFIDGHDLLKEVLQNGRFKQKKILQLLQELLPVLDYIHSHKVLHRDIKPENIMRRRSSAPNLILIDFGAAKQFNSTLQQKGANVIYTPGYAAMEQMMGQPCPGSDIYSLGVTSLRLLTQSFPSHDQYGNRIDKLCFYDRKGLNWQWKEYAKNQAIAVDQKLADILDKMIEPCLENRYSCAQEVLADIERLKDNQSTIIQKTNNSKYKQLSLLFFV